MEQLTLLAMLAPLMLSACAPSAEAVQTAIAQTQAAAGMSDVLANRLNRLLEAGAPLNAMTMQGFTLEEYERAGAGQGGLLARPFRPVARQFDS